MPQPAVMATKAGTLNHDDYTVAWIAPLEIEARAALHLLDERHHGGFPVDRGDDYVFHGGSLCGYNVVVATLSAGQEYGTGSAAALASQVKKSFRNLWFGLLVGVAAGLPDLTRRPPRDIRLGDVLVGLPDGNRAGFTPYDLGKETENGLHLLRDGHVLATTEPIVRSAIGSIKLEAPNEAAKFLPHYEAIRHKEHANGTFIDPGQDHDILYLARDDGTEEVVQRTRRPDGKRTRVWYGAIGSGDKLLKSGRRSTELRDKYDIIGLEMEAAGIMNQIPVGVVRGVCNYGDMHKNKEWQPYAAAMAAAYAKALLYTIPPKTEARSTGSVTLDKINQTRLTDRSIVLDEFASTQTSGSSPDMTIHEQSRPRQHREPSSTMPDPNAVERGEIATRPHDINSPLGRNAACVSTSANCFILTGAQYLPVIRDSLLSLEPVLRDILQDLVAGHEMNLCNEHLHWLENEFKCIIKQLLYSKADNLWEPPGLQDEEHTLRKNVQGRLKRKHSDVEADDEVSLVTKSQLAYFGQHIRRKPDLKEQRKSRRYETWAGNLLVQTRYGKRGLNLSVHFTLIPTAGFRQRLRTGFTMIFQRAISGQNIERCLRTFQTVEREGSAFEMIENGDLDALKAALSNRTISPFDRLIDDESTLISFASREVRLPICEFLLDSVEGTDPCEADSDGMNALRLLMSGFEDEYLVAADYTRPDDRLGIVAKLVERGCLEDESWPNRQADDGCLHLSGCEDHATLSIKEFDEMTTLLIKSGAGLEIRDQFGKTPLLDNINIPGERGQIIIKKLLDSKANVQAVDNNGNGVFHLALQGHYDKPECLQERLNLLRQKATGPDFCRPNHQGYTPSDFALTSPAWQIWCETLAAKISTKELLDGDSFLKKAYQEQMADTTTNPRPVPPRQRATRTVVRGEVICRDTIDPLPQNMGIDHRDERPYLQCRCRSLSIPFVHWKCNDAFEQQLPGLPRCSHCDGYVLPQDMEMRKRAALQYLPTQHVYKYHQN